MQKIPKIWRKWREDLIFFKICNNNKEIVWKCVHVYYIIYVEFCPFATANHWCYFQYPEDLSFRLFLFWSPDLTTMVVTWKSWKPDWLKRSEPDNLSVQDRVFNILWGLATLHSNNFVVGYCFVIARINSLLRASSFFVCFNCGRVPFPYK